MGTVKIAGPGPVEMKLLAMRLRTADPKLRRDLRKELRQAAGPVARKTQDAIFAMPSHHDATLRAEVAGTVTVQATTARSIGVSIVSLGARMPDGKETLPAHLNSVKGWSHPVYARGARFTMGPSRARRWAQHPELAPLVHRGRWAWVRQMGRPGWFDDTIRGSAGEFQDAARKAMDACRDHVEGHL